MRLSDMLLMSCSNLWKRKVRTVLTILGVVIGVSSIVVMVSLGLGLSRMSLQSVEEFGGLTTITVYEGRSWDDSVKEKDKKHLDDALVQTLEGNPLVKSADPILEIYANGKSGKYETSFDIKGMTTRGLQNLNLELGDGELPLDEDEISYLYGNQVLIQFYNPRGGSSYWEDEVLPDVDLKNDTIFVVYDTENDFQTSVDPTDDGSSAENSRPPKKHIAKYSGLIKGGVDDYNEHSWSVLVNMEALKKLLKREFKGKAIPNQPTMTGGKPYKDIYYSQIKVNVVDVDHMEEVQKWISDMGYQAESNTEWIQQVKQQSGYIQAVLGGIGAVSLVVAAIGITNTMMMSIYERTREIGVMKVLGCDMGDIRSLFLLEAGFIGFFGGVIGSVGSVLIAIIINKVTVNMGIVQEGGTIAYTPLWLLLAGMVFAVLVGMVSGFFPARRAMLLSPLAAIRND